MVAIARRESPDLRFEQGSMLELDLPDGALAGAVSWYSSIHTPWERLPDLFGELRRVLAPGGICSSPSRSGTSPTTSTAPSAIRSPWTSSGGDRSRWRSCWKAGFAVLSRTVRAGGGHLHEGPAGLPDRPPLSAHRPRACRLDLADVAGRQGASSLSRPDPNDRPYGAPYSPSTAPAKSRMITSRRSFIEGSDGPPTPWSPSAGRRSGGWTPGGRRACWPRRPRAGAPPVPPRRRSAAPAAPDACRSCGASG